MTLPADKPEPPVTLTDPDMMSQDISKPLGQWFASRLSAREDVRRAVTLPADVAPYCPGHKGTSLRTADGLFEVECGRCARRLPYGDPRLGDAKPPPLVDGKCPQRVEAR